MNRRPWRLKYFKMQIYTLGSKKTQTSNIIDFIETRNMYRWEWHW